MPTRLPDEPVPERAARLRHTPLFAGVPPRELRALAAECTSVGFAEGETLIVQGDPSEAMFIVVDGVVDVSRTDAAGATAKLGANYRGEFVGEMGLLDAAQRSATVTARTAVTAMAVHREAMERCWERQPEVLERVRVTIANRQLQHVDRQRPADQVLLQRLSEILGGMPEASLQSVREALLWQWFPAGTDLIVEGDEADSLFVVLAGRVQAYSLQEDGGEYTIAELKPGDVIGESVLASRAPRNASVRCLVDCEVLCLTQEAAQALIAAHPELEARMSGLVQVRERGRIAAAERADRDGLGILTAAEIAHVVGMRDGAERNHLITKGYWRLSMALREILRAPDDANWACYGCRASFTAGESIRGEDVLASRPLRWLLTPPSTVFGRVLEPLGRRALREVLLGVVAQVQDCVANGNLRIFAEIGAVLTRFAQAFEHQEVPDAEKLDAFLQTFPPGPPEHAGMDVLREAMETWYQARFETDAVRRSQLILLGNALIGVHEQTRVQPDLVEALEAPLRLRLGDELGQLLFERSWLRVLPGGLVRLLRPMIDAIERRSVRSVAWTLRRGLTRTMMKIRLSDRDIRLGRPVPTADLDDPFDPALDPIVLPRLAEVLAEIDPDDRASAASSDWSDYPDRMRFIVRLFRVTQREPGLFDDPYGDGSSGLRWAKPAR